MVDSFKPLTPHMCKSAAMEREGEESLQKLERYQAGDAVQ